MTITAQHPPRRAGAADEEVLLGGKSPLVNSTPCPRLQHIARQIHSLGPAALAYLLEELSGGRDLVTALEKYAALAPYAALIEAYAVRPGPFLIEGGRR
jgi:hypothetical protein